MNPSTSHVSAARRFALLAFAGCASLPAVHAAQTLRYNFDAVNDPATDPVLNLAPAATQNGAITNSAKITLLTTETVNVNGVNYLLGKSLQLDNVDGETGSAGHVDTGLNPTAWGMANSNTTNRPYTVMAWVKFGSTVGDNVVFGQLGNGFHLGSRNGNFLSGHWGDDIGPDQGVSVPTGTGAWQHVAWTNDATNNQSIYRNGVLVVGPGGGGTSGGDGNNLTIGTFVNNGSFIGALDEIKVFGDQVLTPAQIQAEMTNTLSPVTLASLASAKLDNIAYTFTLQDFAPNSIVNSSTVTLEIDGSAVTPTSVTKSGGTTTVVYNVPSIYLSASTHTYVVSAKDQSNPAVPNISATGSLTAPVLPLVIPGPAGTAGTWSLREHRDGSIAGSTFAGINALAALPAADPNPDPADNIVFDGTAPVLNHAEPGAEGDRGNFNNDFPYIGHVDSVPDNSIAFLGKTQLVVSAAGPRTFSVHSDDGFAFRISGGPSGNTGRFLSSNKNTPTNGIDPADPQTIFFQGGTGDSATTGVYDFTAPGTYDLTFVSVDGAGGSFFELASAPGTFRWDRDTTTWALVGSPNDPTVTSRPYTPRFLTNLPGPSGGVGTFGIRTYFNANGGSAINTSNWLAANRATRLPGDGDTFDLQRLLNLSDNRDATTNALQNFGFIPNDDVLPDGRTAQDNVITTAKGRVTVATAATYTISARGDDGFLLRVKAVTGPNPVFSRVTHPDAANGDARLEMSNLNEMFYTAGTGDSNTRGIIFLPAGQYDLEYFHWEGGGGFAYELAAAIGEFPHGTEPALGWKAVGFDVAVPSPASLPRISAAGWSVDATAPNAVVGASNIANALAALAAGATTSTWDVVNFTDPQSGGGPATLIAPVPWPRDTASDDNAYAMRATSTLEVPVGATYRLGYQGDDGGYLIIRGLGATPTPSFSTTLIENATGVGVVEAEDPTGAPSVLNKLRTETGTGNSRTIGQIVLTAGEYQIETLVYEGGGGSYWSVIGAIEPMSSPNYFPLAKAGILPPFANSILPLSAPPTETIAVTNFSYNPGTGEFSLTFASMVGFNYQLEYSTAMEAGAGGVPNTWNIAPGTSTPAEDGTTTTITGNLSSLQPGGGGVLPANAPRAFLRVRRL